MSGGSKLARQMAYKKQLEEEYRLAAERMNVPRVKRYSRYSLRLDEIYEVPVESLRERKRTNCTIEKFEENSHKESESTKAAAKKDMEIILRKQAEEKRLSIQIEAMRLEELAKLREKEEEEERLQLLRKKEEEVRRLEEERLVQEEKDKKRKLEEEERKNKLKEKMERERAQRIEEEKRIIEVKELEEIRKLKLEEDSRTDELKRTPEEEEEIKKLEEKEYEEMKKTEERIKQLELSIASLDDELERYDIEHMKAKTKKVMKRMSLVISDTTDDDLDNILQQTTVKGFMENEDLWGKYLGVENKH